MTLCRHTEVPLGPVCSKYGEDDIYIKSFIIYKNEQYGVIIY